jgi:hypothetical protein
MADLSLGKPDPSFLALGRPVIDVSGISIVELTTETAHGKNHKYQYVLELFLKSITFDRRFYNFIKLRQVPSKFRKKLVAQGEGLLLDCV